MTSSSNNNWYDRLIDHLKSKPDPDPARPDMFRKVTDKLGQESSGLTPLDIVELPVQQKEIMLLMLRDHRAATEGISVEELRNRLKNTDQLENTLAELTQNSWLLLMGEAPHHLYKVHLRAKRRSGSNRDMWSMLAERLATTPPDSDEAK